MGTRKSSGAAWFLAAPLALDAPLMTPRFEAVGESGGTDHVTGLVRIYPAPGGGRGLLLEVVLDGLGAGNHAWHIHAAPCDEQGPVAVAITATADGEGLGSPLAVASEGASARASVVVPEDRITLDQLRSGRYSLRVHRSAGTDPGPAVACADLTDAPDPI